MYGGPIRIRDLQAVRQLSLTIRGYRENFDLQALLSSPKAHHTQPIFFAVTFGDSCLPRPGPLSKFFRQLKGQLKKKKRKLFLKFWGLDYFQPIVVCMPKWNILGRTCFEPLQCVCQVSLCGDSSLSLETFGGNLRLASHPVENEVLRGDCLSLGQRKCLLVRVKNPTYASCAPSSLFKSFENLG